MFDEYIPEELERVIKQQHEILESIEIQKKSDHKKLFSILIIRGQQSFLKKLTITKLIICERKTQGN